MSQLVESRPALEVEQLPGYTIPTPLTSGLGAVRGAICCGRLLPPRCRGRRLAPAIARLRVWQVCAAIAADTPRRQQRAPICTHF